MCREAGLIEPYPLARNACVLYNPIDTRRTQMLEQAEVDKQYFMEVLERHGLATKWAESGNSFRVE